MQAINGEPIANEHLLTPHAQTSRLPMGGVSEGCVSHVLADGAFLSGEGRVQRDLTVAAVNAFAAIERSAPNTLVVLDALCASGLRALRVALEVTR